MFKKNPQPDGEAFQEESKAANIFEDFTGDSSLGKDLQNIEKDQKKDVFFYIKKVSFFLKITNLFLFLVFVLFILYAFFQNSAELKSYPYLSSVCSLFLWQANPGDGNCYPVKAYLESKDVEYKSQKEEQVLEISKIIGDIYEIKNFAYSETMSFLLERTRNRLKPIEILSEFDALKTKFEPIDKSKIECYNIVINDKNELSASCDAYSSDWDTNIIALKNGAIVKSERGGTSVSVASSFIDFINSYPESKFYVQDKQKVFSSEAVSGKWIFTKKTAFSLKLQYNSTDTLIY